MPEPRLAVRYHFYHDHDTLPVVLKNVRSTYDGPLALATDYMVFNLTKDHIRVRMAPITFASLSNPPRLSTFSVRIFQLSTTIPIEIVVFRIVS